MFRSLNGQLVAGIVVHDFRDAAEGWAVLAQHILVFLGPGQLHVHEALTAPRERKRSRSPGVLPSPLLLAPTLPASVVPKPASSGRWIGTGWWGREGLSR